jgi:UDP-N-acetylglucosamine acyltransferase
MATGEGEKTVVGDNNLLMAYVHLAHNCIIGNGVILANAVNLAGHVRIDDYAIVGGMTPVHQFVRIGRHAFIGGGSRVPKDVPPFVKAAGNPLRIVGLNSVGLQRREFPADVRLELKRLYRLFYRSNLNVSQAIAKCRAELRDIPEVREFLGFVEQSERGVSG